MPAPKGNRFWEMRSSHGRDPIFKTPEELWSAAVEYFDWVVANPLYASETVKFQGKATLTEVPKMRAMTVAGLCLFLGISQQAWSEYKQRKGFGEVTSRIDDVIRTQKFAGAAADLLNANIIARDLGLADKSELTGKNGGPIETKSTDDLELARRIAFILAQADGGEGGE